MTLTYQLNIRNQGKPSTTAILYANARRNPNINQEDRFAGIRYPGTYPNPSTQNLPFDAPGVLVGETIIIQALSCGEPEDFCYPSDADNPPTCSVNVKVSASFTPSCQPTFAFNGPDGPACTATCQ